MDRYATSDTKVTYILGAGASAHALPTVKKSEASEGLSDMMRFMAHLLEANMDISAEHGIFIQDIVKDFKWLADSSDEYGTVDTFAKSLFLHQKWTELKRLKFLLSFYFTIEQLVHEKLDKRTLIFLTSVLQYKTILPTNIKILNWNYDSQLQIAGNTFQEEAFNKTGTVSQHTPPLFQYYPSVGPDYNSNVNDFGLVHLNGIASMYNNESDGTFRSFHIENHGNNLNDTISLLKGKEGKNLITFAWESTLIHKRIDIAKTIVKETDYLVIIGYSFPFFNRDIDKEVFESLKESAKLKKIYYQDPFRTGDFLREQFVLPPTIDIKHISDTQNYFIPNEL